MVGLDQPLAEVAAGQVLAVVEHREVEWSKKAAEAAVALAKAELALGDRAGETLAEVDRQIGQRIRRVDQLLASLAKDARVPRGAGRRVGAETRGR